MSLIKLYSILLPLLLSAIVDVLHAEDIDISKNALTHNDEELLEEPISLIDALESNAMSYPILTNNTLPLNVGTYGVVSNAVVTNGPVSEGTTSKEELEDKMLPANGSEEVISDSLFEAVGNNIEENSSVKDIIEGKPNIKLNKTGNIIEE